MSEWLSAAKTSTMRQLARSGRASAANIPSKVWGHFALQYNPPGWVTNACGSFVSIADFSDSRQITIMKMQLTQSVMHSNMVSLIQFILQPYGIIQRCAWLMPPCSDCSVPLAHTELQWPEVSAATVFTFVSHYKNGAALNQVQCTFLLFNT